MSRQPQYSIEARQLNIAGGLGGHMFWVLRDNQGNVVAEMHGLATDRDTGRAVPIGTDADQHSLRGHHLVHDAEYARNLGVRTTRSSYIQEGQEAVTLYIGDKTDVLARWKAGHDALGAINRRDLDYPPGGIALNPFATVNSNSVYTTLGQIMIDQAPRISYSVLPGHGNHALSEAQVEDFRYSNRNNNRAALPDGLPYAANPADVGANTRADNARPENPRVDQAIVALRDANAGTPGALNPGQMNQDQMAQIATNMAIYTRFPELTDDPRNQSRPGLERIGSAAFSEDRRTLFVSDAPDLRNATTQNVVAIPTERLTETPRQEHVQRLQDAQTLAQATAPLQDPNAQTEPAKKAPSLSA